MGKTSPRKGRIQGFQRQPMVTTLYSSRGWETTQVSLTKECKNVISTLSRRVLGIDNVVSEYMSFVSLRLEFQYYNAKYVPTLPWLNTLPPINYNTVHSQCEHLCPSRFRHLHSVWVPTLILLVCAQILIGCVPSCCKHSLPHTKYEHFMFHLSQSKVLRLVWHSDEQSN
jgi:hypothetical protein